jgi:hypothetical protein
MKTSFSRVAVLICATLGAAAAPTPASSQDFEALRQCFHNCYEAYVVITQQPAFYDQCRQNCYDQYGTGGGQRAPSMLAVKRYN